MFRVSITRIKDREGLNNPHDALLILVRAPLPDSLLSPNTRNSDNDTNFNSKDEIIYDTNLEELKE